jgi:glucosamine--fructose-6-phosphate aminotransferase (isomerizing)
VTTALLRDIHREPVELAKSLAHSMGAGRAALERASEIVRDASTVYVTGIGSSWHASMAVQSLFHRDGRPVVVVDASELLHFTKLGPKACVIALSRSGKSVEIVGLLEFAARSRAPVIAVTNTPESPLAQRAAVVLQTKAAFDHNISITMYTALALTGGLLAESCSGNLTDQLASSVEALLKQAAPSIPEWASALEHSGWFDASAATYFLARGGSLSSAHEARLLWEEAAGAPATAMSTGGFRHGPQEMLREGVRIGLWIDAERLRAQDLALARDIRENGGSVMLTGQNVSPSDADLVFHLPAAPAHWQFLVDVIPAQLAAERLARLRGVDCDSFRYCPYIIETEGGLGR